MTTEDSALRVLRCRSGALDWAVEERAVREVAAPLPLVRLPGAPAAVLGLGNLRGVLVTVVDAGRLLGQPAVPRPKALVVVEVAGRRVALGVDEVDDLHRVPLDDFALAGAVAGVPEGVIISRGQLDRPFLLLDPEALVAPLFPLAAPA